MMHSTLFAITLVFALAVLRVRADFTVYTPVLTQCQPATLNWDQAAGPYDVIIVPTSDPCGDALLDLGDAITGNSYQWGAVPLPAGTEVMVSVLDSAGEEGWSGAITVQQSNDNSCLTTTPQSTPAQSPTPETPTRPSSTSSSSVQPTPTVVGASNNGLIGDGNGGSMLGSSVMAVFVTALGAWAALL